jgi:hypothetical protein
MKISPAMRLPDAAQVPQRPQHQRFSGGGQLRIDADNQQLIAKNRPSQALQENPGCGD